MLAGPGALLGTEVWMSVAITYIVTVGKSCVGPGGIGGAEGSFSAWANIAF